MWCSSRPAVVAPVVGTGRSFDETPCTSQSGVGDTFNNRRHSTRRGRAVCCTRDGVGRVGTGEPSYVVKSLHVNVAGTRGGFVTARAASRDVGNHPLSVNSSGKNPSPGVQRRRVRRSSGYQRPGPAEPVKTHVVRPSATPGSDATAIADAGDQQKTSSSIVADTPGDFPETGQHQRAAQLYLSDAENDDVLETVLYATTRRPGKSTTPQAMANAVNILLGVGLLSVPYALKQGGWAGLGVLGLLGAVTNYTGKVLIRCQDAGSLPGTVSSKYAKRPLMSYEDIGEFAFGKFGRGLITTVLYTELLGTCALFFILEGDHLSLLFENVDGLRHSSQWWQTASAFFMVPTLWLADLSSLSVVGALGATASVSLMGVVAYQLFAVPGFSTPGGALPPGFESTALLHLSTLPVSFGLLAFVFAGHAVFPAIYTSMEKPEEYEQMLDKTYVIVGITCAVIGAAGYSLYGDGVKDEVTLNLPNGIASTVALALIAVNPLSKFALTMDPVARGLEEKLGIDINGGLTASSADADALLVVDPNGPLKARVLRTGLGASALLIAAKVPFFAIVMSLIGSFLTLTVSVIFPAACHLKVFEKTLTNKEKATDWAIMFVGGFCVVAGSVSAVTDLMAK